VARLLLNGSTVGGNTTCITIELENDLIIFDAGSGIRELSEFLMDESNPRARKFVLAGVRDTPICFSLIPTGSYSRLPFFKPIHIAGNVLMFIMCMTMYHRFGSSMDREVFPSNSIRSRYIQLLSVEEEAQVEVAGAVITNIELNIP